MAVQNAFACLYNGKTGFLINFSRYFREITQDTPLIGTLDVTVGRSISNPLDGVVHKGVNTRFQIMIDTVRFVFQAVDN